jgi:hypothetical protein
VTTASFTQVAFRVRNDDGNETTATWVAAQNTNATIQVDSIFRARFRVSGNNTWSGKTFNLRYSKNAGAYTAVSTITPIRLIATANYVDGADSTTQLTGGSGTYLVDNNGMRQTGSFANTSGAATGIFDIEFCLQLDGTQVVAGDTYALRIYDGTTALTTYTATPTITAANTPRTVTGVGSAPYLATPASFTPASVANLMLWLDANDAATITQVSGSVSAWANKGYAGGSFTQSNNTLKPTLLTRAIGPGIYFYNWGHGTNPDSNFLLGPNDYTYAFAGPTTMLAVVRLITESGDATEAGGTVMSRLKSEEYQGWEFSALNQNLSGWRISSVLAWQSYPNKEYGSVEARKTGLTVSSVEITDPKIVTAVGEPNTSITGISDSNFCHFFGDATTRFGTGFGVTYNPRPNAYFVIGGATYAAGPGGLFNGDIHEILIYPSRLAFADIQRLEGYLAWKWGLTAQLPAAHPYKSAAPAPVGGARVAAIGNAATIAAGAGTAGGASGVVAGAVAITAGVGSAAGAGTAGGVGAKIVAGAGSSTGTGTVSGVGGATAAVIGSASGLGAASGVGNAIIAAVGSAAGASTAFGISPVVAGIVAGTGTCVIGAAGPFTPASIPGLLLWLDAADSATITQSSGFVSAIANKGSAGGSFTQPNSGNQFALRTTAWGQALYSANATYTTRWMSGGTNAAYDIAKLTVVSVANTEGEAGLETVISRMDQYWWEGWQLQQMWAPTGSPTGAFIQFDQNDVYDYDSYLYTYSGASVSEASISTHRPFVAIGQRGDTGTQASITGHTPASGDFAAYPVPQGVWPIILGGQFDSSDGESGYWDGDIHEVLLYDNALSDTDRQKIEGYLAWKWGLQADLPSGHPYKSAAPAGTGGVSVIGVGAWTTTAASVGTAAGLGTANGVGARIVAGAGSAAGAGTAGGVGAANVAGVGTTAGLGTASGVGTAITGRAGTAGGTATVVGVGASIAVIARAGTASGTSAVQAFGVRLRETTASAGGGAAVSGAGQSVVLATGQASGSATAIGVMRLAVTVMPTGVQAVGMVGNASVRWGDIVPPPGGDIWTPEVPDTTPPWVPVGPGGAEIWRPVVV